MLVALEYVSAVMGVGGGFIPVTSSKMDALRNETLRMNALSKTPKLVECRVSEVMV